MLKFAVKNQSLMRLDSFRAAEDSVNYLVAEFDILTDDWDGATITATFSNGEKTVDAVLIENRCMVPWETLEKPVLAKVSLFGVKGDKIITTDICSFSLKSTLERGSSGKDPTPDAYQQIINMIEAGKVKGPQGDPGPQGPRGETGQTGPQGPIGETGQRGPQGEIGQTGQTGPAGQDGHTPVKGVDYWTASDKQEIYAEAEQALRDQEQSSVAAIRAAGADEVEKVQIKGAETLESIPEDYSALTAEVSGLKGDLVDVDSVVFETIISANLLDNNNCLQDLIPKNWSGQDYNQSYSSDGKWSTPAIPVIEGEKYYLIATDGVTKITPVCIAYGADGLFSKQIGSSGSDSDSTGHVIASFNIPDGIAWVRLYASENANDENPFALLNFKRKTDGVTFDFEVYGNVTKLPKVATSKEVDTKINNLISEMDVCNLIVEKGTFYSNFEQAGTATFTDAPYQYKRNGVISKKITMPIGDTTASRAIFSVNGVQDNIVLFLYLAGSDYTLFNNEPVTIQCYISKNSAYNNAYFNSFRTSLTVGWNAIKFNLDEMSVNGTPADKSDLNCVEVNFKHSNESTKEVSFLLNGILVDSKMRPVIMVNHDGVYASDIEDGGKLAIESQYNIPTTVFTNGMGDSTYKDACMDAVGTGMIEIGQYSCRDIDGIASDLGLSDARTALSDETTIDALTQYKLLKGTHDIVRDQLQGGDVIAYAGNQGYLTGMTMRTLRKLGIKIGRCTGHNYIGFFSKNEFAVGSVGLYTSVDTDIIKGYIDSAIAHGAAISLFTHTVTDAGEQYGCTKAQYAEIMSYIANLRDEGKCDLMTFRQFVDACY